MKKILFLIGLSLITLQGYATVRDTIPYNKGLSSYGYVIHRIIVDSVLVPPRIDTTSGSDTVRVGSLVFRTTGGDHTLYIRYPDKWERIGTASVQVLSKNPSGDSIYLSGGGGVVFDRDTQQLSIITGSVSGDTLKLTRSVPVFLPYLDRSKFIDSLNDNRQALGYDEATNKLWLIPGDTVQLKNAGVFSVNGKTGIVTLTTDSVPEGDINLYFTQTRARTSVSGSSSIGYNSSTGIFSAKISSDSGNTLVVNSDGLYVPGGEYANKDSVYTKSASDARYLRTIGGVVTGPINYSSTPVASSELVNKAYVDALASGLSWKDAVIAASTGNLDLSGLVAVDGVSVSAGERVLVKNQTDSTENGIYIVASGAWTRATDASQGNQIKGMAVYVDAGGVTNGGTQWVNANTSAITVGTTGIYFTQFGATSVTVPPISQVLAAGDSTSHRIKVGDATSTSMTVSGLGNAPFLNTDGNGMIQEGSALPQVNVDHLGDSLHSKVNVKDSTKVYVTPAQLNDSTGNYVLNKDSLVKYVTPSQLGDSANNRVTLDTLASISDMESYSGNAIVLYVSDTLQGGVFYRSYQSLTADSGVVFNGANDGEYWVREYDKSKGVDVDWWGSRDSYGVMKAVAYAGKGGIINFAPNKLYLSKGAIIPLSNQLFNGNNAILKRANDTVVQLAQTAALADSIIEVNAVPSHWAVGDWIQLFQDSTANGAMDFQRKIIRISGDSLILNKAVGLNAQYYPNNKLTDWNKDSTFVHKTFAQFSGNAADNVYNFETPLNFTINNLTFDGNKKNNSYSLIWKVNQAIYNRGYNAGCVINDCKFFNIPNDCINGHGFTIINNKAVNLNASFVHLSACDTILPAQRPSLISGNYVDSSNLVSPLIVNGHSYSVIELSYSSGYSNIVNNRFSNALQGYVFGSGLSYPTNNDTANAGFRKSIYEGNYFHNFVGMAYAIPHPASSKDGGAMGHILISNNVFDNCGSNSNHNDWSSSQSYINDNADTVMIGNNLLVGGTTWTLPIYNSDSLQRYIINNNTTTAQKGSVYVTDSLGSSAYANTDTTLFLTAASDGKFYLNHIPAASIPTLQEVTDEGSTTTNSMTFGTSNSYPFSSYPTGIMFNRAFIGTKLQGSNPIMVENAKPSLTSDSWTQTLTSVGSALLFGDYTGFYIKTAPAGQSSGGFNSFWGTSERVATTEDIGDSVSSMRGISALLSADNTFTGSNSFSEVPKITSPTPGHNAIYFSDASGGTGSSPTYNVIGFNGTSFYFTPANKLNSAQFSATGLTARRTYTLPDVSGTLSIKENTTLQSVTDNGNTTTNAINVYVNPYTTTIKPLLYNGNNNSGGALESSGSVNFGMTGAKAVGFSFRWLAHDNGAIDYSADTDELMRLTNAGYLGIGKTNPGEKLEVNGNGLFDGNVGVGTSTLLPWDAVNGRYRAVQVTTGSAVMGDNNGDGTFLCSNAYFSGSNWTISNTSLSKPAYITVGNGGLSLYTGPLSAVGASFTPTQVFSVDASGNLTAAGGFFSGITGFGGTASSPDATINGLGQVSAQTLSTVSDATIGGNVTTTEYRVSNLNTAPSSATDTGTTGEIRVTSDYIYVCIATNTWVRAALSTW